jgi:pimeloyl-ACP methyl ester carboxylesterase
METIELPAGRIHYRVSGPEGGRPVVFVHGFLVDDTLWADVPERLGEAGFRSYAPVWPLGSHPEAMRDGADLSLPGVARIVLDFLAALDLEDVVLVGNDTGGGVSQTVVDTDPSRIGRLVLTNCDAFETFPPAPFNLLFRLGRHPGPARLVLQAMRSSLLRNSRLGVGGLVRRKLTSEESRPWVLPYLTDAGVRRDVATFCRAWHPGSLLGVSQRMAGFDKPVLLCWAPKDPFLKYELAKRLLATFPDATLVELREARLFVPLDAAEELADRIAGWAGESAH